MSVCMCIISVCVRVCVRASPCYPKKPQITEILWFTSILNEKTIEFFFFKKHLYLIAYKIQGIKKQVFGVKCDEILAYFIKSWI